MKCEWSKQEICRVLVRYPSGQHINCNGHHSVCLGQAGKVRDVRDGAFQIPLDDLKIPRKMTNDK